MYSHDTFGLGHLRRTREIAHAMVERRKDVSVLIVSGSPIIGSFDFRARVDFVRVPGVIKLRNGEYVSLNEHVNINETVAMRSSIIEHTAEFFQPDVFIVDKEPLGLRGEIEPTLTMLKEQDCRVVLGVRDILDEPLRVRAEWLRKGAVSALEKYYDHLWVYGLPEIYNPLQGVHLSDEAKDRMTYLGYLRRRVPSGVNRERRHAHEDPFVLVTAGGGGDGDVLIDWVLRAYEADPDLPLKAHIVTGPFIKTRVWNSFVRRIGALDKVTIARFDAHLEQLMAQSVGVVCMGGYNTFCEILSLDKPAVIVPREVPRLEQTLRATRACELGLARVLPGNADRRDPTTMIDALRGLTDQAPPSQNAVPGMMDGLSNIGDILDQWFDDGDHDEQPATSVAL
ncbi:MAG: glycosyltransferase [Pseudomonadota bacterium]